MKKTAKKVKPMTVEAHLNKLPAHLHWMVPIIQSAIASSRETATRAEVLKLLKAEAAKATDPLDKKRLQSLIELLEKDDHIPGSSAKPEDKV